MRIYYQDKRTAKLIERLAKGLRISSAANDAAGLAISEKMKAQIRGLDQANQLPNNVLTLLR